MTAYIIEVQKFNPNGHKLNPEWNGKSEHLGYMNIIFKTKQQACCYYDKHNSHMRSLNAHNNWRSDWDPDTYLQYIVRERGEEYLKIQPFVEKDKNVNIILDAEKYISEFVNENIMRTDEPKHRIKKTEIMLQFKSWFQESQGPRKMPKGEELYAYMDKKFGICKKTGWHGIKIIYPDEVEEEDNSYTLL